MTVDILNMMIIAFLQAFDDTFFKYKTVKDDNYVPAPDVPIFGDINTGDDSLNVSWTSAQKEDDKFGNPGSRFYMEYKKSGSSPK